jgi:hypothetical protein
MLYNFILDAIQKSEKIQSDTDFETFLHDLQPYVQNLRKSYKQYPVLVDYSEKKCQQAYLLTYFPHYTLLLRHVLVKHLAKIETHTVEIHDIWLFGGGPCPEFIGYGSFLRDMKIKPHLLGVYSFDIAADTWVYSRNLVIQRLISDFKIQIGVKKIDITEMLPLKELLRPLVPTVAVFQNCLNEIKLEKHSVIIKNIKMLFNVLPPQSTIIMIDLDTRDAPVKRLIEAIETELASLPDFELLHSIKQPAVTLNSPYSTPPAMLTKHLLIGTDGLIPRKKLNFIYSVIRKVNME